MFCNRLLAMGSIMSEINMKDFFIPNYILSIGSEVERVSHLPVCPVIVFINSKSGGQLGGELLVRYRTLLNKNQVIRLMLNLNIIAILSSSWLWMFKFAVTFFRFLILVRTALTRCYINFIITLACSRTVETFWLLILKRILN